MKGWLAVLFVLWAAPALADGLFITEAAIYGGLAAWDGRMTVRCVRAGVCHEANPVIRPFVDRHSIETAMTGKVAVQSGFIVALGLLRPRYRRETTIALTTLIVLQGYVDYKNCQTLHRQGFRCVR